MYPTNFYIRSHYSIDWHRDDSAEGREVSGVTALPMPTQFNHSFGVAEWHGRQQRWPLPNAAADRLAAPPPPPLPNAVSASTTAAAAAAVIVVIVAVVIVRGGRQRRRHSGGGDEAARGPRAIAVVIVGSSGVA
jgi:hypothetical protein